MKNKKYDSYIHFVSDKSLQEFHDTVFNLYDRHGETKTTIDKILNQMYSLNKSNHGFQDLQKKSLKLIRKARISENHYIDRIIENDEIKVSLHCIPKNYEIPAHCHPGMISITYVLNGNLQINQSSLEPELTHSPEECITITSNDACIGLKNYKNIHKINTQNNSCSFLSIRLKKVNTNSQQLFTHQYETCESKCLYPKKLLPLLVSGAFLLSPSFASDLLKVAHNTGKPFNSTVSYTQENIKLANKLRMGLIIKKDSYQAARLYLKSAKKGNAEAQYWLGIMYLEGQGITDDSEKALRWVSAAADQEYSPAKKLLHIMLTTDEILDC